MVLSWSAVWLLWLLCFNKVIPHELDFSERVWQSAILQSESTDCSCQQWTFTLHILCVLIPFASVLISVVTRRVLLLLHPVYFLYKMKSCIDLTVTTRFRYLLCKIQFWPFYSHIHEMSLITIRFNCQKINFRKEIMIRHFVLHCVAFIVRWRFFVLLLVCFSI